MALAGGRHCAQRGGAASIFIVGIILIGIAFFDWHSILRRRQHLRVGGGRHCVQRGGAARFKKKALLAISYKQIKKLPYRYVAMSSHVPYKSQE